MRETRTELTTADARLNATCAATAEMPSLTLQMEKNAILDSKLSPALVFNLLSSD